MIVPMKKVSLITLGSKKRETLKKLRKLGLVHIESKEASSEKITQLKEEMLLLENAISVIEKTGTVQQKTLSSPKAVDIAKEIASLTEEKKTCSEEKIATTLELERLKDWGNFDPDSIKELKEKGIDVNLFELSKTEYDSLKEKVKAVPLSKDKFSVKCLLIKTGQEGEEEIFSSLNGKLEMPQTSTLKLKEKAEELSLKIKAIEEKLISFAQYTEELKKAVEEKEKEIEFELYDTGMEKETLSEEDSNYSVAYFKGYIEKENTEKLKKEASKNCWGLLIEEPTEEDNVPTKLKNNKFVSLVYPLTDFLGTVPGYFEYDISGWFLTFILIFFGIIFGDGGYGLAICSVAAVPIIKALASKKSPSPLFLLIGLFGLSTILWGTLTCTWFGLSPEQLPQWLKSLSVPVISNVNADKIWYPFWTEGKVGLTTSQNLQILCFTLALIQLSVAHIKGAVRNRKSAKILGDIGAILQLLGIYYLVLSLVVNPEVFTFGLVIGGIPVGTVAIALIGIGFVLNFVFANFEGNIIKSILASLTNIVSVLLGTVNFFSDIVSYIRLWAVGLAGAAISATVNELAGPLLGNFMFMILAIVLLVFGHGLNMILNVLSVIVHGIRLNTLEFSSHLDMSWSGHKFKPFKE